MTVVLMTSWCSIKHIEAPYMFDWEHGIALLPMQGIRASSPTKGNISKEFSSCGRNLGSILELQQVWPFESPLCSENSGLLSSSDGHVRNLNYFWHDNTDASGGEVGNQASLSSFHRDIGTPINFQEESSLVSF